MKSLLFLALLFVIVTAIASQELEEGLQTFTNSDVNAPAAQNSTQKLQKRLATKEIIMYLTPTQIKNLQSGLAYITSRSLDKYDGNGLNQEKEYLYNIRNLYDDMKELKNQETLKPITEFQDENLGMPISQNKQVQQGFKLDLEKIKDNVQLQGQQDKELATPKYQWIPYNPVEFHPIPNQYHDILLNKQNKEEGRKQNPIFKTENSNSQFFPYLQQFKGSNIMSLDKPQLFNFASRYNNNKNIQEMNFKLQHMNQLEKQRVLAEIEAIVSQNKAIEEITMSSFEHTALPLPFLAVNTEPFYGKQSKPKPSLPSPIFYSSKKLDKLQ